MNERNVPQWQRVVDRPEALKFVALLVVTLIALLVLAAASPWLIGRLVPTVLGLDSLHLGLPDKMKALAGVSTGGAAAHGAIFAKGESLRIGRAIAHQNGIVESHPTNR